MDIKNSTRDVMNRGTRELTNWSPPAINSLMRVPIFFVRGGVLPPPTRDCSWITECRRGTADILERKVEFAKRLRGGARTLDSGPRARGQTHLFKCPFCCTLRPLLHFFIFKFSNILFFKFMHFTDAVLARDIKKIVVQRASREGFSPLVTKKTVVKRVRAAWLREIRHCGRDEKGTFFSGIREFRRQ